MHFEERKRQQKSRIPGPPFSFENTSFPSLKLCRAMQFIIFLCRFQVWNCVGRCNLMKFHAFLCRFQVWNCIDRCNVSHVYAILKCETLSFDVIWKNIILLWVHALLRDPLKYRRTFRWGSNVLRFLYVLIVQTLVDSRPRRFVARTFYSIGTSLFIISKCLFVCRETSSRTRNTELNFSFVIVYRAGTVVG